MQKIQAAVLIEYKKFEWKEIDYPLIKDHEAIIKVKYASISGTDQHIFSGDWR